MIPVLILAMVLPVLLAAAFLLGRHLHRQQPSLPRLSVVSRQHIELFQGGQLNEALVDGFRVRFNDLLERGESARIEASLRPGTHYIFQVRALTEIGSESAGNILERQLQHRLTDDPLEQCWYWIDLAGSLRQLNRQESLPHLLRCAESSGDNPLSPFFAAETVCFLGFTGYLKQFETPLGRSALRLLLRLLDGLRCELPPQLVAEARLGEMIEILWDNRPDDFEPLLVPIVHAVLRLVRRAPHAERLLDEEAMEQESFVWQMSRLAALEPVLLEFMEKAPPALLRKLEDPVEAWGVGREAWGVGVGTVHGPRSTPHDSAYRLDVLKALIDLRVDTGAQLLPLLARPDFGLVEPAVELLTWSKDPQVGPWLRQFAMTRVPMGRRSQWRKRSYPPSQPSLPATVPYRAILRALRGHPSIETENFLMLAAQDWDPTYRQAACSSFGWWEPLQRSAVIECLRDCRCDASPEIRQTARAALARLGERQALYWFRHALTTEDSDNIHEAMHVIGVENLFMLWPDLDRLADSETLDIAHHARETLENLCEDMDRS